MDQALVDALVDGLGGPRNIVEIEPCILRIRVVVADQALVDESRLRRPGVLAVVRSGEVVQVVAGPISDGIAAAMSASLGLPLMAGEPAPQGV